MDFNAADFAAADFDGPAPAPGPPPLPPLDGLSDPAFMGGMVHAVSIEQDANCDGSDASPYGQAKRAYAPVAGWGAVACRCTPLVPSPRVVAERPEGMVPWVVLFPYAIALDSTHRLVFVDGLGAVRRLYVDDPSYDEGGAGHHYVVRPVELRPMPS